jgi:hypothetical protein
MSAWGIGLSAPSEETQVLRERLSSKGMAVASFSCAWLTGLLLAQDAECADLQTQLIKRTAEISELNSTLNETLHKVGLPKSQNLRQFDDVL